MARELLEWFDADRWIAVGGLLTTMVGLLLTAWAFVRSSGATSTLVDWREEVRRTMRLRWLGTVSPLSATRAHRQRLSLQVDAQWLHPTVRQATRMADGTEIQLSDDCGPGDLFDLMGGSYLIVGEAGAGKSVLIWQTLEALIDRPDTLPIIIEAQSWAGFDVADGPVPSLHSFVASRFAEPSIGAPYDDADALAREATLLIDGLDELAGTNAVLAQRLLRSMAEDANSRQKPRPMVLSTRPADYDRLIEARDGVGTSAVANAVVLQPYEIDAVVDVVAGADPPRQLLVDDLGKFPTLARMVLLPLWLGLAIEVYGTGRDSSPLAHLPRSASDAEIEEALYAAWIGHRLEEVPGRWRKHVGFLAWQMNRLSKQTLQLEDVQFEWLMSERQRFFGKLFLAGSTTLAVCTFVFPLMVWASVNDDESDYTLATSLGLALLITLMSAVFWIGPIALTWRFWRFKPDGAPRTRQVFSFSGRRWRRCLTKSVLQGLIGGAIIVALAELLGLLFGIENETLREAAIRIPVNVLVWLLYGAIVGFVVGVARSIASDFEARPNARPKNGAYGNLVADLRLGAIRTSAVGFALGVAVSLAVVAIPWFDGAEPSSDEPSLVGVELVAFWGIAAGLFALLTVGVGSSIFVRHLCVRVVCAMAGLMPVRLVSFLGTTVPLGVMYRVGPGFRFRHRTLAGWLAADWEKSSGDTRKPQPLVGAEAGLEPPAPSL